MLRPSSGSITVLSAFITSCSEGMLGSKIRINFVPFYHLQAQIHYYLVVTNKVLIDFNEIRRYDVY